MGLTYNRGPTVVCDLGERLFNVPPVTLGERVKRRIVRKLPMWRPAPANPLRKESTTSANASRTVGSSDFCVRSCLGEHGH